MNASKLHLSLAAAMNAPLDDDEVLPIILKVRRGPIARAEARALAKFTAACTYRLLDAQAVVATRAQIAELTEDPAVELIWPDLPVHTWLDRAVPAIHAPRVWESGFTGRGVKVALIDTGLDPDHPDLRDRLAAYRDFLEPDSASEPQDPNGHGTHVAGILGGSGQASEGRYRGVAPEVQFLVGRALDATGNGRTSQVMAAIEWAVEQGAQVINISLGGAPFPSDGTDALSALCNAAVGQGVVVCVAAGNLGPAQQTIGSPAAAERVITVGAAEVSPDTGLIRVAAFSSRGPTGDGRTKPDVIYPGVGIVAPRAAGTSLGSPMGEHYTSVSGTSQATPMASGTAALLLQANPRHTPEDIKSRMMRGAHQLPNVAATTQGSGLGDSYNTFVASRGEPIEQGQPAPGEEQPPHQLPGCRSALTALLKR